MHKYLLNINNIKTSKNNYQKWVTSIQEIIQEKSKGLTVR